MNEEFFLKVSQVGLPLQQLYFKGFNLIHLEDLSTNSLFILLISGFIILSFDFTQSIAITLFESSYLDSQIFCLSYQISNQRCYTQPSWISYILQPIVYSTYYISEYSNYRLLVINTLIVFVSTQSTMSGIVQFIMYIRLLTMPVYSNLHSWLASINV